jgi:hypothetical protein
MDFSLVELAKVGGPILALAALALLLNDRHVRSLLTMLGNHLTHVDDQMEEVNTNLVKVIEKLEHMRKE